MTYWLDTSALVKRYVQETGTAWIASLFDGADPVVIATITVVELVSALTRRANRRDITATDLAQALAAFRADGVDYLLLAVDPLLPSAQDLAERLGLRAFDAVQLAGALEVQRRLRAADLDGPVLVTADQQLVAAAEAEGLVVTDPQRYP